MPKPHHQGPGRESFMVQGSRRLSDSAAVDHRSTALASEQLDFSETHIEDVDGFAVDQLPPSTPSALDPTAYQRLLADVDTLNVVDVTIPPSSTSVAPTRTATVRRPRPALPAGPASGPRPQYVLHESVEPWSQLFVTDPPVTATATATKPTYRLSVPQPPQRRTDSGYEGSQQSAPVARLRPAMAPPTISVFHGGFPNESRESRMHHVLPDQQSAVGFSAPLPATLLDDPTSHLDSSQTINNLPRELKCEECDLRFDTKSEYTKHMARHERKFICDVVGCTRSEGFATPNDLQRHKRSVHNEFNIDDDVWKCFVPGCKSGHKLWPRQDNFRAHITRMHEGYDVDEYVNRSNDWLQNIEKPRRRRDHASQTGAMLGLPTTIGPMQDMMHVAHGHNTTRSEIDLASHYSQGPEQQRFQQPEIPVVTHQPGPRSYTSANPMDPGYGNVVDTTTSDMIHLSDQDINPQPPQIMTWTVDGDVQMLAHDPEIGDQLVPLQARSMPDDYRTRDPYRGDPTSDPFETGSPATYDKPWPSDSFLSFMGPHQDTSFDLTGQYDPPTAPIPESTPLQPGALELGESSAHGALSSANNMTPITFSHSSQDAELIKLLNQYSNEDVELQHKIKQLIIDHQTDKKSRTSMTGVGPATDVLPIETGTTGTMGTGTTTDNVDRSWRCQWPGCGKIYAQKNVCVKHYKRHKRMFFCTFDDCYKTFGTKQDMQRHENSCQTQQECWRCYPAPKNSKAKARNCSRLFESKDEFEEHARLQHPKRGRDHQYRIDQAFTGNFWCGFCDKVIENPVKSGVNGIARIKYRYDHIEKHIKSEGKDMASWVTLSNDGSTKAEMQQRAVALDDDDDDDLMETPEEPLSTDLSATRPRSASLQIPPTPYSHRLSTQTPTTPSTGDKRKHDSMVVNTDESSQASKRLRSGYAQSVTSAGVHHRPRVGAGGSVAAAPTQAHSHQIAWIQCCQCRSPRRRWDGSYTCPTCFRPVCYNCTFWASNGRLLKFKAPSQSYTPYRT